MTPEDEEFNRIEREAAMRKEAVKATITPREWVGLTEKEVDECYESVMFNLAIAPSKVRVYQAIEAKLREKNA
jgi:hypothetical protein